jgi:signal transduction histidine kinase
MSTHPLSKSSWAAGHWPALSAAFLRAFHRYANWLVGISWKRFILLSLGLLVLASVLAKLPPFSWRVTEVIEDHADASSAPAAKTAPRSSTQVIIGGKPVITIDGTTHGPRGAEDVEISIDSRGIRVHNRPTAAAASAASAAAERAAAAASAVSERLNSGVQIVLPPALPLPPAPPSSSSPPPVPGARLGGGVQIILPDGVNTEALREELRDAKEAIEEAIRDRLAQADEAREAAREAEREARAAEREARRAAAEVADSVGSGGRVLRTRTVHWGDFLTDLAFLWIVASAIIKGAYKGRFQAEEKAAQATETAEAEQLKRQVVEARMAAMQAQIEPHFLFNTLASIDHLIETDPQRASQMQKNLIALLRASMPTMREASGQGGSLRDLAHELQVIRPYLEILKVRMEERLATHIDVPDGLLSAEFPPMMIQTLVENAIQHGLEPKADGGSLSIKADIVDGKLRVTVADTGRGFGQSATGGTGVGLANIRERLQLIYGAKASLTVAENPDGGTRVSITVPYRSMAAES